jgi:hypothetical protein
LTPWGGIPSVRFMGVLVGFLVIWHHKKCNAVYQWTAILLHCTKPLAQTEANGLNPSYFCSYLFCNIHELTPFVIKKAFRMPTKTHPKAKKETIWIQKYSAIMPSKMVFW